VRRKDEFLVILREKKKRFEKNQMAPAVKYLVIFVKLSNNIIVICLFLTSTFAREEEEEKR